MKRCWITGAHGFIGRHLAHCLADQGHQVSGIGHGAWPQVEAMKWGISTWINGEISASNLGQLRHSLGIPDSIFHLAGGSSVGAAIANPFEDFNRTVHSTAELIEWLRQESPGARLVAVSSAAVYGSGHNGAIKEEARLAPFSPYGYHKLMMEELCRSYAANFDLQVVLPRLFSVYGSELKKQLLWDLCSKFALGGTVELSGSGDELRDWTDVRDVARALGKTVSLASTQAPAFNVATGVATSVREIATMVAMRLGGVDQAKRVQFNGQSRLGDPFSLVADIDLMRSHGIECRIPLTKGIDEYIAWFQLGVDAD